MSWVQRSLASFSVTLLLLAGATLLLFNWSAFGWKALSVPTGSMRPHIPPGSLVLVHHVPNATLKVGDVITYSSPLNPKETISHRIVKSYFLENKVPAYITKGDANPSADPPVVGGLVQGQVVWHVPHIGEWLMWSKTWLGIAVLVYAPALLITIEEILRLNEYYGRGEAYRLFGYKFERKREPNNRNRKFALGSSTVLAVVFIAAIVAPVAEALLTSNTVKLTQNKIAVAASNSGGGGHCSGNTNNNTNININNSSTQTATTGNASNSNNTNGGAASSGTASNSNSTTITVGVTNCH